MAPRELLSKLRMPLVLLLVLLVPALFGDYFSYGYKVFFYTISLSIKSILLSILPFMIFSFVSYCLISLSHKVITLTILLISTVFISSFIAFIYGYFFGDFMFSAFNFSEKEFLTPKELMLPLWTIPVIRLAPNEVVLLFAFTTGILLSYHKISWAERIIKHMYKASNILLRKILLPLIPLFILGFVFRLESDDTLDRILSTYGIVFVIFVISQFSYVLLMYLAISGFSLDRSVKKIRNMLPAAFTAFSTLSSMAAMPFTIVACEKNLQNKKLAQTIVPTTVNIHTLGTAIGLSVILLATCITFNYPLPSFKEFVLFAFFASITKFAGSAIVGGVILTIAPLFETYLGFTPEMTALAITLCILFDPIDSAFNVMCNGAFAVMFGKICKRLKH